MLFSILPSKSVFRGDSSSFHTCGVLASSRASAPVPAGGCCSKLTVAGLSSCKLAQPKVASEASGGAAPGDRSIESFLVLKLVLLACYAVHPRSAESMGRGRFLPMYSRSFPHLGHGIRWREKWASEKYGDRPSGAAAKPAGRETSAGMRGARRGEREKGFPISHHLSRVLHVSGILFPVSTDCLYRQLYHALASSAEAFRRRWAEEWSTSPCSARLATFDNAKPGNAVKRLYEGLTRPQCSVLTQLRTGHIGLNAFLFRFHLTPSPNCPHCGVPESVPHFLLSCRAHHPHRLRMILRLGTARLSLARLLAAKSEAGPVLEFIRDTGRLPRYAL